MQVYAPTTDYDDETIEKFYDDLEEAIDRKNNTHVIVMGDFNAKIGKKGKDENNNWIGNHGIGVRNERGERLLDFAAENRLFITNTLFEKHTSRYWTWESPGGIYKNQIDFILTTDKTIFQNTEILTQVDIGSDHRLLRGKIKMNKKLTRLKKIHRKKAFILHITFIHPSHYFHLSFTLLLFILHITFIHSSHYGNSSFTLGLFILHITFIHPAYYFYSFCTLLLFLLHSASAILNLAYVKEHLASFISDTESFRSGRPRKDDTPTEAKDLQSPSKNGWVDR